MSFLVCVLDDKSLVREQFSGRVQRHCDDFKVQHDGFDVLVVSKELVSDPAATLHELREELKTRNRELLGIYLDVWVPNDQLPAGETDNKFYCKNFLDTLVDWGWMKDIKALVASVHIGAGQMEEWLLELKEVWGKNVTIMPLGRDALHCAKEFLQWWKETT